MLGFISVSIQKLDAGAPIALKLSLILLLKDWPSTDHHGFSRLIKILVIRILDHFLIGLMQAINVLQKIKTLYLSHIEIELPEHGLTEIFFENFLIIFKKTI